ncbi:MAG TPA: hypothetical protein VFN68_10920 [Acidimicrobiales bacterium]|nr:hypothetical protein [Acidimicrobiales bacterium]
MIDGDAQADNGRPDPAPEGSGGGSPAETGVGEGAPDQAAGRPGGASRRPVWARDVESLVQNLVAEVEMVQRRAVQEAERALGDARAEAESIVAAARHEAGLIGDGMRIRREERAAEVAALRTELQELTRAVDATLAALEGVFRAMGPLVESVDAGGAEPATTERGPD